jgi:hypothetical protein
MDDQSRAPKTRVRATDLRAIAEVRRLQENPELGGFRIHAALKQIGIELCPRTCGRILALNRKLYHLSGPQAHPHEPKAMPFKAVRRQQYWTVDIRYLDMHNLGGGMIYVIAIGPMVFYRDAPRSRLLDCLNRKPHHMRGCILPYCGKPI